MKNLSKHIFLIDAIGALVSAFFLGVVLVRFIGLVGMPLKTLHILAIIPCFFAVYSFCCYFFLKSNWRPFLKIIAVANLMYCCLTLGLLIFDYAEIKLWGFIYFLVEIAIIGLIVTIEYKLASSK